MYAQYHSWSNRSRWLQTLHYGAMCESMVWRGSLSLLCSLLSPASFVNGGSRECERLALISRPLSGRHWNNCIINSANCRQLEAFNLLIRVASFAIAAALRFGPIDCLLLRIKVRGLRCCCCWRRPSTRQPTARFRPLHLYVMRLTLNKFQRRPESAQW